MQVFTGMPSAIQEKRQGRRDRKGKKGGDPREHYHHFQASQPTAQRERPLDFSNNFLITKLHPIFEGMS